jgi:dolichol-phosphate mannosyltransferase
MDADLQHDERILPQMLQKLKAEKLQLVVATRNAPGGGMDGLTTNRVRLSQLGRRLSRLVARADLSDPMSGFFVLDRSFLEGVVHDVSGLGFKILLDLVASSRRPVRFGEVAYEFRERQHGVSKLDIVVGLEYLELLLDKTIGDFIPPRFIIFSIAGTVGLVLTEAMLYALFSVWRLTFPVALTITTFVAMTVNFFLNNTFTYRDRRLKGRRLWTGLAVFYAACSVGVLGNIQAAEFLRQVGTSWYLAGAIGLAIGAVWNYGVTSITTWRQVRRRSEGLFRPKPSATPDPAG